MLKKLRNYFARRRLKNFSCKFSNDLAALSSLNKFELENNSSISSSYISQDATLIIGANSYIRSGAELFGESKIGRFCSIGHNFVLGLEKNAHPKNWLSTSLYRRDLQQLYAQDLRSEVTKIGNDCWIGRNVMVMSGVKIGDGVIIGAGSLVTKDLKPYGIYAGTPVKLIKYRFDEHVIAELLKIKWWNYALSYLSSLPFSDIVTAISLIKSGRPPEALYDKLLVTANGIEIKTINR